MNGDLSLSQSLGGLRIANPDDDARAGPPSASTSPVAARQPAYSPTSQHTEDRLNRLDSAGSDLSAALGYNPSAYSSNLPSDPPTPLNAFGNHDSKRLSHRQSMPIGHRAQQQQFYPPHSPDRLANGGYNNRPSSGFFDHSNLSTSAQSQPADLSYSRLRGDSNPSARPGVQRSLSKAGAAAAMQAASSKPTPQAWGRQPSNTSQSSGPFPPRRSSRPGPSGREGSYGAQMPTSPGPAAPNAPLTQGSLPTNSEEWKDRGAAVGVQRTTDKNGKPVSKVVKKGVKDFQFAKTLGEGSYSTVLAAMDRQTGRAYAIKVLDKKHIIKEKKVKYVNIEKDTLNRLTDHPGIVRLYYTFQDERSLYFVLDLAAGGELLGVLKKYTSFDEECSKFYSAQILDAIEYMHTRGIIHRDLKPENVLLDDQGHVKITDFGTAKILDLGGQSQFGQVSVNNDPLDGADTDRAVSFVGTAEYVSPELLTDKNACKASDLWAFGCIVYQLLAGRPPFKAKTEYLTFQKIVKLDYSFPEGFPAVAKDLIEKLLVLNPGDRLPINGIKDHPFFTGIQWGKGLWKQKPPKLRSYNPSTRNTSTRDISTSYSSHDTSQPSYPKPQTRPGPSSSISAPKPHKSSSTSRPQHRLITEIQPPTQLDIDWSPVLTKTNERILKIGELNVFTASTPGSPTARTGSHEIPAESSSKISRFFSAATTKKRQRLVILSSRARLILAPTGGDRKEAKVIIDLTGPDVSWKAHQDAKGYTVWCIYTRDKQLTFEDPKANTGDPGSSVRSSQEWIDIVEDVNRDSASAVQSPYSPQAMYAPVANNANVEQEDVYGQEGFGGGQILRNTLRKDPNSDNDSLRRGNKRFSKRHSKNGLAAVF